MKIGLIALMILGWPLSMGLPARQAEDKTVQDETTAEDVRWLQVEEGIRRAESQHKKIMLDVYTDWCSWCKRMDQTTFSHPEIASYLNEHFVTVKFDAEFKGDITYKGKTYTYVKSGKRGYHELAAELLRGRLSFPTTVFLDENGQLIQAVVGYKTPGQFEQILTYFAGNHYMNTPWSTYQRNFVSNLDE